MRPATAVTGTGGVKCERVTLLYVCVYEQVPASHFSKSKSAFDQTASVCVCAPLSESLMGFCLHSGS